jgi:hypothetical protein
MKASGGIDTFPISFIFFFAFLLLVEKLALTADVTAVALRGHVLSHFTHVVTSDDLATDSGLDGDLEHLRGDNLGEFFAQIASLPFGLAAMYDGGKGIHGVSVHHDLHLYQVGSTVFTQLVVHGAVTTGDALEAVVEIDENFVQRQRAGEHDARGIERVGVITGTAFLHHKVQNVAQGRYWECGSQP